MNETFDYLLAKQTQGNMEIYANPWDTVPIKNYKQAKNTTEVHLGKRKATILKSFEQFPNLQIVWLNSNNLKSLEGLEKNFRIKHLFLHENKIKSISGILVKLKYIETLFLYDNQLRDLDCIIKQLKELTNLRHLELFHNPAAHQPNYKFRVIAALPSLEILDRHKITQNERTEAENFMNSSYSKKKKTSRRFV